MLKGDFSRPCFEAALPGQIQMKVKYPYTGAPSYFETLVNGDPLTGTYEGWCVDTDHVIYQVWYTADVYSSYEDLPVEVIDIPENLDLVNWIINQDYVGQLSSGCIGNNTYGEVQRAIWTLIDPNSTSGLGSWSECRVAEIVAAAQAGGQADARLVPHVDQHVINWRSEVHVGEVTQFQ